MSMPHDTGPVKSGAPRPFLSYALRYAGAASWAVFPLIPATKEPLTAHGFKDASTDVRQITAWWEETPTANVAIATGQVSGLVVIDVDPKNGGSLPALAAFFADCTIPATRRVFTGGGGWHYYYALPEGVTIATSVEKLGDGIDVKAEGGYVVAPPSIHPDTKDAYTWDKAVAQIALLPARLVQVLNDPNFAAPTVGHSETDSLIVRAGRNNFLTRMAGRIRRQDVPEEGIYAAIWAINLKQCAPPLGEDEVRKIAHSVARYEPKASAAGEHRASEQAHALARARQARVEGRDEPAIVVPDRLRMREQEEEIVACILTDASFEPKLRGDLDRQGTEEACSLLDDVLTVLAPQHCYGDGTRLVLETMQSLARSGANYTLLDVDGALAGNARYPGIDTLRAWMARVTNTQFDTYLRGICLLVLEAYRNRGLMASSERLQEAVRAGEQNSLEVSASFLEQVQNLASEVASRAEEWPLHVARYRAEIDEWRLHPGTLRGVTTGIADLDRTTSGIMKGQMCVIGARASMGKTAFGLSMLLANAFDLQAQWETDLSRAAQEGRRLDPRKRPFIGIISLEMQGYLLVHRLASIISRIPAFDLLRGRDESGVPIDDSSHQAAVDVALRLPIKLVDATGTFSLSNGSRGAMRPSTVQSIIAGWQSECRLTGVIIDYLQLMKPPEADKRLPREERIAAISGALKAIAVARNVPLVVLAQLSRQTERSEGRMPDMSHIRESGAIEQDSDQIVLIFRDDYYVDRGHDSGASENRTYRGMTKLILAKNRNGPVKSLTAYFDGPRMAFHDVRQEPDGTWTVLNRQGNPIEGLVVVPMQSEQEQQLERLRARGVRTPAARIVESQPMQAVLPKSRARPAKPAPAGGTAQPPAAPPRARRDDSPDDAGADDPVRAWLDAPDGVAWDDIEGGD